MDKATDKNKKKTKTYTIHLGPLISIGCMWLFLWVGSNAEVWWRTALIATAFYAGLRLLADLANKPKKKADD